MVALLLADGFEEIEAMTPVDVLRRAGIEVKTFSISEELCVCGAHNILVDADDSILNIEYAKTDAVILPGGLKGTENLENNKDVECLLEYMVANKKLICAICAAPKILGKHGYLDGKRATCYPDFDDRLGKAIYTEERVVVDRNFITSKGVGTAMDFSLAIVEYIKDKAAADKIARNTMYI